MNDQDRLFDRLLSEYISQSISPGDKELFFSMILTSGEFRKRYEEAARLNTLFHLSHFNLNKEKDFVSIQTRIRFVSGSRKKEERNRRYHLFLKAAVTAVVLIMISVGSIYLYKATENDKMVFATIEVATPLGGVTRLVLPDGSVIWLNSKSILEYDSGFGNFDRKLFLSGEAYFEVSKNELLPFSVVLDDVEVIATGTVFNVRSYPDDLYAEVQLVEGGVDVLIADRRYSLDVDEKAVYDKESGTVILEPADSYRAIQWTKGKISFDQAYMHEIYKMLERYFNVTIHIESERLKDEYFFGSINLEMSLSQILDYLDMDKKYKIEMKDNIIYITDR